MNNAITCAEARSHFWLLEYGELTFDEEERLETHLDTCADCRAAREREKELYAAFDGVVTEPPPSLLRQCRAELAAQLESEPVQQLARPSWWEQFKESLSGGLILRPAGALALLAAGFVFARLMPNVLTPSSIGVAEAAMDRVRDVQTIGQDQVRILVDQTRERTVSGSLNDGRIRALLLEAAKDPNDAGLRQASLTLLNADAGSADVRDALVYALRHDQNAGVRLNAMQGLKAFASQSDVRGALSQTLLSDPNPGIRMQAIDLLTQAPNSSMDRQTVGTLQELMMHEDNPYLRERSQQILQAINASTEIY
jgi:hypothetical protein